MLLSFTATVSVPFTITATPISAGYSDAILDIVSLSAAVYGLSPWDCDLQDVNNDGAMQQSMQILKDVKYDMMKVGVWNVPQR